MPQGQSGRVQENLAPTWIRSPDCAARNAVAIPTAAPSKCRGENNIKMDPLKPAAKVWIGFKWFKMTSGESSSQTQ